MGNILFCGSYIPHDISVRVKYNSQAANNFQNEIIKELRKTYNVEVLSYIGYPVEDAAFLSGEMDKNGISHVIKCVEKNYLKVYIKYYKLLKSLLKGKQYVFLYNYNYINLLVNYYCHSKGIKTVLIIADHSEPCEYKNPVRRLLASKYAKDYNKFDYLIFLSRKLMERYKHKKSLHMEGGINPARFKDFSESPAGESFKVLYSGLLSDITGVDLLLEAIELIENVNIEFLFSGKGDLETLVSEYADKDKRVKNLGFLSEEEYLRRLNEANILINPRNMDLPQNQNNFPSKVLDYLAAGKVIISTLFPGYEKFSDNIIFCDSTPESLALSVKNAVLHYKSIYKSQFEANRNKAYEFSWVQQVNKIIDLIRA